MQKKTKKVLTAVLAVLFTLSAGYFVLVAPTTAWYYQEKNDSYSFTFGKFNVEQDKREEIQAVIPLRAATRFADAGEILFDEVVHVVKVDAENIGELTAQIEVNVTETEGNPEGLKWFVYDTASDSEIPEVTGKTVATKGEYKTAIENMLTANNVTPVEFESESTYETYNQSAIEALDAHNEKKVVFSSGEKRVVYVVFWAEYGEVKEALSGDTAISINYDVAIEFEATPYIPELQNLVIENQYSGNVNMVLYTGDESQTLTVANGEETSVGIEVGTPYKIVINSNVAAFSSGSTGTVSKDGLTVTGTITNSVNNIIITEKTVEG